MKADTCSRAAMASPRNSGLRARSSMTVLTLGVGAGPYLSITQNDDLPQNRTGDGRFSGLVSLSASYRFTNRWLARLTWNRLVTRYDRDADIIAAGVGMRF